VFAAPVIQHTERMRRIILSSVACQAVSFFFPHYTINGTTCGENVIEHKMRVLIFSTTSA
jgi:hypothetical protein